MVNYSKLTEYPRMFRNTYWGRFECNDNDIGPLENIINNRNTFVKTYDLKRCITDEKVKIRLKKKLYKIYDALSKGEFLDVDHIEFYDTGTSIIGVSSGYCAEQNEHIWEMYGFNKLEPLYSNDLTTFMYKLNY